MNGSRKKNQSRRELVARLTEAMKLPIAALVIASVLANLLMLTGPLFMLQVYDRVLTSRSMPTLVVLSILVCGLYVFYALIESLRSRIMRRVATVIDRRMSSEIFRLTVRLNLGQDASQRPEAIRDADNVRQFLMGAAPLCILDLPWVPVYLAIVFALHPVLGWLAVGGAVLITVLLGINELLARNPSRAAAVVGRQRELQALDAAGNAESIVAMGMLPALEKRWADSSNELRDHQGRAADRNTGISTLTKTFRLMLQSAVLAVGAALAIQGKISPGSMIAASIITSRALAPIEQLVSHWRVFLAARRSFSSLVHLLPFGSESVRETAVPLPVRSLEIRGFSAGPSAGMPTIVSGVEIKLAAGDALGVIGPSGSGKSSLVRALAGVWPVVSGEYRLDGVDFAHFDPRQRGQVVGYLPQSFDLFDGTVAENISRFSPVKDDEAILAAAEAANAHDLISGLPNGYDTQIGPRGSLLSAGQRQRVGLARSLFANPFLVILDEPNSNLDAAGDRALNRAIRGLRDRRAIVIVVAHRPSALAEVDTLLYVSEGRQVAFGGKEEVLSAVTSGPQFARAPR